MLLALGWVSTVYADEPETSRSKASSSDTSTADATGHIRAVVVGLRQSLFDTGVPEALTRASDWAKELELSWNAHRDERVALGLDTHDNSDADPDAGPAAAVSRGTALVSRPFSLNLGLVTFDANGANDHVWALGHAQPLTSFALAGTAADTSVDHRGSTTGERALASHDIAIGLRVPMMPWNATISADHYWWGLRGFGRQVSGSRVGLKLSPIENVEIEGGRAADTRGKGGFIGVLYHVPLDP